MRTLLMFGHLRHREEPLFVFLNIFRDICLTELYYDSNMLKDKTSLKFSIFIQGLLFKIYINMIHSTENLKVTP